MSNYTKSTNFATKDNLTPGDPLKVVRGTEIDTEFNNISTAIATKTDNSAAAITGGAIDGATVGATTPATGAFTTLAASGTTTLAGALVGAATQSAFNTVSTTLNLGGAATALNLGAATGTATVNNTTLAAKAITASTTLAVTGTSTLTGAVTATAGVSGPITSSSVSITGGSITGITDLAVADGGTGASTAAGALNNLLPSQTSAANKYLQSDGTNASWDAVTLSTADITGTLPVANGGTGVTASTGTGSVVLSNSPTLVTPALGTPSALVGTNITGTASGLTAGNVTTNANLTGAVTSSGNATSLGSFSSANLLAALTDETGTGSAVFATSPTLVTPVLGTPTSATLTNATGLPLTTGVTGTLPVANGGTNLTSFTSGGVVYASSSSALATGSVLSFDGTNLGVGNASPQALLHVGSVVEAPGFGTTSQMTYVNGTSQPEVLVRQTTNDVVMSMYADSTGGAIRTATNHPLIFITNNTEKMRLDTSGNLGIGTSSPATQLHVVGNITASANNPSFYAKANNSGLASFFTQNAAGVDHWRIFSAMGAAGEQGNFVIRDVVGSSSIFNITTAGNVGIGTSSPNFESATGQGIHVNYSAGFGSHIKLTDSASGSGATDGFDLMAYNTNGYIENFEAGHIIFRNNGSERARITSGGDLLIGATSGVAGGALGVQWSKDSNGGYGYIRSNLTTTYGHLSFYNPNGLVGQISTNGSATTYATSSDYRLKNTIAPMTGALAKVALLKPVTYKWNADGSNCEGFIAHELAEVVPHAVTGVKDAVDADGNPKYQGIDVSFLVATLTAAIQEQQALIVSLKARLDAANL